MATMSKEINELLRNHVKEKLGRGEVVASMTVRLVRGVEIAHIAKSAGFDSLYVDLEHSSFSLETTGQICIAALEAGITPLGHRSAAGPLPHLQYRSFPAAAADAALNQATLLIVQFESEEALSEADAIAAVEGVDLV